MDLTTQYLGLTLESPFMPGASPLDDDLDTVLRLEDAGASAIVMHSLFEEDIRRSAETTDRYLEQLLRLRRRVRIPVIASLNGTTADGWLQYATLIQRGGADALELNFYHVATDVEEDAASVERRVVDIVAVLKESVRIPLAVKLSPFYSALPHLAAQLERIGADGLVLFNRFYQPDIDPERRELSTQLHYSDSSELLLRLRWIAILSGRLRTSLALTGGVHEPIDAVKAVLAGAHVVQMVSALMLDGPKKLRAIRDGFTRWGDDHGYDSVREMCGAANLSRCPNPAAFERGNYQQLLQAARDHSRAWSGH
jgi:dihydroorotate dehydrogenase (fumarate)